MQNKDEISNLLEGVKAMDQQLSGKQEESSLAEAFGLAATVADKLIKQITAEQQERQKNKRVQEAEEAPSDDDLLALGMEDLPDEDDDDDEDDYGFEKLPDDDDDDEGEHKHEHDDDDEDEKDLEKEEARVLSNLKVLSADAKKMESAVRKGKVNVNEAKEILAKMLKYIEPLIGEDDQSLSVDAVKNNKLGGREGESVKIGSVPGGSGDSGIKDATGADLKSKVNGNEDDLAKEVTKGGGGETAPGEIAGLKNVSDAELKKGTHGHVEGKEAGKTVEENKDEFLTVEQVRAICPSCADKMESLKMTKVKASIVAEAIGEALGKK